MFLGWGVFVGVVVVGVVVGCVVPFPSFLIGLAALSTPNAIITRLLLLISIPNPIPTPMATPLTPPPPLQRIKTIPKRIPIIIQINPPARTITMTVG